MAKMYIACIHHVKKLIFGKVVCSPRIVSRRLVVSLFYSTFAALKI